MSTQAPWVEELPYLLQVPGVGWLTGLGAGVHASGTRYQTGRITKEGRREVRRVLVEAAQTAVRTHPHGKAVFARREARIGAKKAIVAIADTLLISRFTVKHHVASILGKLQVATRTEAALRGRDMALPPLQPHERAKR